MAKGIWVRIKNWEKYRGRSDIKYPVWFACSNRLLEDPDFYEFTFEEIAVWIHILSKASIEKSEQVFIHFEEADRKCRLKKKVVLSAISKLQGKQIDRITSDPPYESRTDCVHDPCTTGQDKTRQDKTEQTNAQPDARAPARAFDFEIVYKNYPRKEGKSKGISTCKAQIKTEADYQALVVAVSRYKAHVESKGIEAKFVKHFSTFMNQWRDWLDLETGSSTIAEARPRSIAEILADGGAPCR